MTTTPLRRSVATSVTASAVLAVLLAGCAAAPEEASRPSPSTSSASSAGTEPARDTPDPEERQRMNEELIKAARENDVARARQLVQAGADVNYEDDTQQSAYLIAASEGYVDLLDLTLRNGAEINAKDSYNGTALIRAAERGHADIVGRLVQAGIDLDHVNNLGWTALHEAIVLGDDGPDAADTVRVLVAAGVDISIEAGRDGKTALEHAEERGFNAIVSTLRAASGEVADGDSQLLRAASAGDSDSAAAALRGGADLEAVILGEGSDRWQRIVRSLLENGADPSIADRDGVTPLEHARNRGFTEIAQIFERHSIEQHGG